MEKARGGVNEGTVSGVRQVTTETAWTFPSQSGAGGWLELTKDQEMAGGESPAEAERAVAPFDSGRRYSRQLSARPGRG